MDWLDAGLILAGVTAVIAVIVYWTSRLTGGRSRCSHCGALLVDEDGACTVCQAPFEPAAGRPAGPPTGQGEAPMRQRTPPEPTVDEEQGVLNPGVQPWMVKWAFGLMMFGLGTRLLGMLEPAGLTLGIPDAVATLFTIIGGVGMFMGFVVLDVA